jgi:DNA-binding MarR family transcriptional regulator
MEPIKESFKRVKEDIDFLRHQIEEIKESLIELCEIVEKISKKEEKSMQESPKTYPAHNTINQANQQIIPAHNYPFKALNYQNKPFSIGNGGVPTDRQTNQQTDRYMENSIENAAEILKSLDNIKKEIRQQFKKLTEQEWLVFAAIYQLDEEIGHSDYKILAERLKLTESSIRDYVAKLIKKGISIDKTKINNKNIKLNISPSLKRIASLSAILTLKEL